jgi:dipeptidyl aminopeptidase/acylaminoacyl peptidase
VHGEKDDGVPFEQSVRMDKAYLRAGLPVEFVKVHNAGHDFQHVGDDPITPSVENIHEKTVEFFRHYLSSADSTVATKQARH